MESELVIKKAHQQQSLQQELQSKEGGIGEELSQLRKSWEQELSDVCQIKHVKDEVVQLQVSCHNLPTTSFCLLPEDVRWLNLKQAVFLFTAAEQWEEQNQEEEGNLKKKK